MNEVSITGPAGGEIVDLRNARIRVLEDGSHTNHRIGIAELVIPPHTPGPPQHRHALHDEGF